MEIKPRWEQTTSPGGPPASQLFRRWFLQYSPLYFFSAFCILCGVFLLSSEIGRLQWKQSRLFLLAVIEAYSWLVIGGAALLFGRPGRRRPAVILALLAIPFLFDWTLQTEALGTLGREGRLASVAWFALAIAKWEALLRAVRLRVGRSVRVPLWIIFFLIAAGPHFVSANGQIHLYATWAVAGILSALVAWPPRAECRVPLVDAWGTTVLFRGSHAGVWLPMTLCVVHLWAWIFEYVVVLTPAHLAPLALAIGLAAGEEVFVLAGVVFALLLTASVPPALTPAAACVGLLLILTGRRRAKPWLHLAGIACLALGAWMFGWKGGPFGEPPLWVCVPTALAVFLVSLRHRLHLGHVASASTLLAGTWHHAAEVFPRTRIGWGVGMLVVGFATLLLGLAINLGTRHERDV